MFCFVLFLIDFFFVVVVQMKFIFRILEIILGCISASLAIYYVFQGGIDGVLGFFFLSFFTFFVAVDIFAQGGDFSFFFVGLALLIAAFICIGMHYPFTALLLLALLGGDVACFVYFGNDR